jgi:RNA polymerase sigma-70 factor (ECF subfamily)
MSTPLDALIEKHADQAYAAAFRLTGNAADAWDLVQESFLRALEKSSLYDPRFDFGGWLYRVLYRVFLNGRRDRARLRERPLEAPSAPDAESRWAAGPEESPEAALERAETAERVAAGLSALSPEFRACLVLVDVEGRGYEEAAEILNWPVGSVAGRLFRARRALRDRLKSSAGESHDLRPR